MTNGRNSEMSISFICEREEKSSWFKQKLIKTSVGIFSPPSGLTLPWNMSHQHVLISLSFPISVNLECNSCLQSVSDLWQLWPNHLQGSAHVRSGGNPLPAWFLLSSSRGLCAADTDIRSPPLKPKTAADMSAPLSSPDQFAFRLTSSIHKDMWLKTAKFLQK